MQTPFSFAPPSRLLDFMRQADEPGIVNLAAGVPGHDALPAAALGDAFNAALATDGAAMMAYHHPEGDHALRALLAERMARRGVEGITGGDLILTTGCTQALQGMITLLVRPGDVVACEAPAYYALLELLATAGARVLPIPVRGMAGADLDLAEEAFERWKPKAFFICTTLSNPSGATLSEADRERLVAICRTNGVRLVEDDIYGELVDAGAPKLCRAFDDGSTVSYVTSVSKTVAPGLRVGYCAPGTPELHDAFAALKTRQDLHGCVVSETMLRHFIQRGSLEPHLQWLRERNRRRRELALKTVRRAFPATCRVEAPAGGYMLWVELPAGTNLEAVRVEARKEGVVFAADTAFFPVPPALEGPRFIRLNGAKATEEELVRGLEVLGRCLG